jgi:hypothetical protein
VRASSGSSGQSDHSAAEPQPKETPATEARRHGKNKVKVKTSIQRPQRNLRGTEISPARNGTPKHNGCSLGAPLTHVANWNRNKRTLVSAVPKNRGTLFQISNFPKRAVHQVRHRPFRAVPPRCLIIP